MYNVSNRVASIKNDLYRTRKDEIYEDIGIKNPDL